MLLKYKQWKQKIAEIEKKRKLLTQQEDTLLQEARRRRASEQSGMRSSGFLLENLFESRHKEWIRLPKASTWDFQLSNGIPLDVKGCWAKHHGYSIFIEHTQNDSTGTQPDYIKQEWKDKKCILVFIDYETGDEWWIRWDLLYKELDLIKPECSGGYWATGWKINAFDYPQCISLNPAI